MAAGDFEELIRDALVEIGVKEPGEDLDSDESQDSLRRLRGMLESWGLEGLLVPGFKRVSHTVAASRLKFTLGPAGSVDGADPDVVLAKPIEHIYALEYRHRGQENAVPLTETSYQVIADIRSVNFSWPSRYFYDHTWPYATCYFDAAANVGDVFNIVARGHFDNIDLADQTSDILPTGYREAVLLNLAVTLASGYGVKDGRAGGLSSTTIRKAREEKMKIEQRNAGAPGSPLDPALRRQRASMLDAGWGYLG